jgi:hypothetical protein
MHFDIFLIIELLICEHRMARELRPSAVTLHDTQSSTHRSTFYD